MENRLKEVRTKKGMNASQLAKASGISRYALYLIENHKTHDIKQSTMIAIANALNVSVGSIFLV